MPPRLIGHTPEAFSEEVGAVESVVAPRESVRNPEIELSHAVGRALYETGYAPLFNVECVSQGTTVILRGQVPTYYLKQVAQSAAVRLCGTTQVENQIEVGNPSANLTEPRRAGVRSHLRL
jgi:osmotically-inducible protein OsmY